MVDKNIIDTLLNDVLTRQTTRLPQNVEAMNLQRQLWENLKNETYRPNFRLRSSSPLQFGGPTSASIQYPVPYQEPLNYTLGQGGNIKTGITSKSMPKQLPSVMQNMANDKIIDDLFSGAKNKFDDIAKATSKLSSAKTLGSKILPWLAPIQSGVQAYSNEQRLREMEKWNEYMASQGKPPMYSDEAIKAQKTRGYTASAPLVSTLIGAIGGVPGAIAGGAIGEIANIIGGMLPQQSGYTRAPLTGKYRGMEINQLPQFKGPNGENITTVDQLENVLNNKPGATQSAPAMEEVPSLDKLPPIPEGLGKVDYTEDFINNLVATNGLGVNAPQLRGTANTTPIVEQVTPQTAYDNIYKDLLASREKALANQRENIEQLIDAFGRDIRRGRRASMVDSIATGLRDVLYPSFQGTMTTPSGAIYSVGTQDLKDITSATDAYKSIPRESDVVSTINKLQEASDQAEVDFELAQAELLDKVNIANQLGLPVSMVNKDLLKAQMDNATKEKIANLENVRRLAIQSMISGDKAEQRKLTKALKEAENEVKLHIANQLASQRMATGLMNYFGNAFGDYSALPYITPLLDNPEFESKIQEIINNQGGSQYGYGE